jgi:hypothetical protein
MSNHLHQLRADGPSHDLPNDFGLFLLGGKEDADIYLVGRDGSTGENKRTWNEGRTYTAFSPLIQLHLPARGRAMPSRPRYGTARKAGFRTAAW